DYYNSTETALGSCDFNPDNDPSLGTAQDGGATKMRALQPALQTGISNNNTERRFGLYMSVAGDVNKDGGEDLLVTTPDESLTTAQYIGAGYLFYGPLCGDDNSSTVNTAVQNESQLNIQNDGSTFSFDTDCNLGASSKPPFQKFIVKDAQANNHFGATLLGARKGTGDINGDGYDDIVIGSWQWDNPVTSQTHLGRGVIFFGHSSGLHTNDLPSTSSTIDSAGKVRPFSLIPQFTGNNLEFFKVPLSGGDLNGDNTFDFIVPSQTHDGQGNQKGIDIGAFLLFY
ncbi:MAG: hypothetical protein D6797_02445, partial [Bdellovibrio sp.]